MILAIILILCVSALFEISYFNKTNQSSYTLNLSSYSNVYNINIEQNEKKIEENEQDKINDIVYIIGKIKRKASGKSAQNSPINV
mgnify:FL=1